MRTGLMVFGSIYGTWLLICLVEEIVYRVGRARARRAVTRRQVTARRAVFASRGAR